MVTKPTETSTTRGEPAARGSTLTPTVLVEATASQDPKLYIRTPDGRLIARVTATETPTLDFYYHFDGLGSTRALTDSGGDTTDTYDYDVWGSVTHSGTTQGQRTHICFMTDACEA